MSTKTIFINEDITCKEIKLKDKSKTNFHSICVSIKKSLGGISQAEVDKIWNQVLRDYADGLVIAATMGLEGGEDQHLHVSQVLKHPTLSGVTQKRYESLIDPGRLDFSRPDSRGVKRCITVQVAQPAKGKRKHFSAYRWLAYAHKEKAMEFNDVDTFVRDMAINDCKKYRSIGVFDGCDEDEERKLHFGEKIFTSWQKKITRGNGVPETICIDASLANKAMRFMERMGLTVQWNPENPEEEVRNQATTITKMVLNKTGKERYHLSKTFFGTSKKQKAIWLNLVAMKPPANHINKRYESALYKAIECRMAEVHGAAVCSQQEAALLAVRQKLLKKVERLESICKEHVLRYEKLKSRIRNKGVKELLRLQREHDRKETAMEREYKDRPVPYDRSERSYDKWTKEIPRVEAMDFEFLMDNDVGANGNVESVSNSSSQVSGTKRRRVDETKPAVNATFENGLHSCHQCNDCGKETRADCARDQGVPVHP